MDTAAAELSTRANGVGGVDADPDPWRESMLATVRLEHALDRNSAGNGAGRRLECDEESIARVVDLFAVVLAKERAHSRVVPAQHRPSFIAERLGRRVRALVSVQASFTIATSGLAKWRGRYCHSGAR